MRASRSTPRATSVLRSRCIDTGNSAASGIPATDLDGNPRVVSATVDMGPYEHDSFVPIFSDGFELGDTSKWTITVGRP